jgi:hypothetical protein
VARNEVAVKKYVVKLGDEEREQLNSMINKGKHPARVPAEGSHPAESRRLGRRRRLERQSDRRRPGDPCRYGRPDSPTSGRGRR